MFHRVTLREIALRAGVSVMTVSRAVKKDPRVRPDTASRIQAIARELGYAPDPALSSLVAYRQANRPAKYHGAVAWVTSYPTRNGWFAQSGAYILNRDGAAERLAQHGYNLEEFWLREPGLTAKRASQILFSRGIRGLLICPLPTDQGHLSLDWEKFSALAFGYSMARPRLHLFTVGHYRAVITMIRKLRALGYRRIGYVTSHELEKRMDLLWLSGYRSQLANLPESQSIPVFTYRSDNARYRAALDVIARKAFAAWYKRCRPEVIVSTSGSVYRWSRELGYQVPRDFGIVQANLQESETTHSGVIEHSRQIGRAAADFLVGMLQRGEYGVPEFPQRVLIEGEWFQGKTIREKATSLKSALGTS